MVGLMFWIIYEKDKKIIFFIDVVLDFFFLFFIVGCIVIFIFFLGVIGVFREY